MPLVDNLESGLRDALNAVVPMSGTALHAFDYLRGAPGQSKPPEIAPGAAKIAEYQAAGFTPAEIAQYQRSKTLEYLHAGFSVKEIEAHWGIQPPESPEVAARVANNIRNSGVTEQHGAMAAFEAGWGTSVAGIAEHMATGQDPNKAFQIKPDESWGATLAQAAGQTAGDLGTDVLGFFGGAAAGAAVPGLGETGASEIVGGVVGAAGMGIASQGTREVLLDAYNRGQVHSVSDFLHVVGASTIRTLEAGASSAPFGFAGPIAGKVAEAGAGKIASKVLGTAAATTLGVSTGAALNGKMPDAKDFVTAAAMMLVMHGAIKAGAVVKGVFRPSAATLNVQNNLEEIYRRNGTTPWDAINQAKNDAGIRREILQQDVNGNSVAPRLHANAPQEPPPIERGEGERPMKNVTPEHLRPKAAPVVKTFEDLSTALEGSRDASVSLKGAIGKHQIMLGTARQYGFGEGMSQTELAQWLHEPANNAQVFGKIATDLHARFHGDMNAMLIAYNAGPRRAGEYMTKGPGTELEAILDKKARGGIRYESRPSNRDESFLPMETQKYLANGRRRSGGASEDAGEAIQGLKVFPSDQNHAEFEEEAAGGTGGRGGGEEPPGGLPPGDEPPSLEGPRKRYTPDEATEEIMANIGEPPPPPSLLAPDTLIRQFLSELHPAENIDRALIAAGDLGKKDVGQADMFRQTYASDTRTGAFIKFGILRIRNNEIAIEPDSPSVSQAADEVREDGGNMRQWVAYMLSKRTRDKAEQGIKTGFNQDAAEDLIADEATQAKYERGTATLNKVMTGALEYARDSHYLSQKQVDAMVRDNPAYITMRRIMGDDASFGTGRGKGFVPREALREMEGSDRSVIDPLKATLDNMRVLINMADRNRAIGSIIGQVEAGKLKNLDLKKLEFKPAEPTSDTFKPYGVGDNPAETYSPLLAERASKGLRPNEFVYYRDGVPERWSTKNEALAALIRKSNSPGEVNIIGKIADKVAALDRAGITLEPGFSAHVVLRHQITAFIADPLHPPPFVTMLSGLHDVITQKGSFPEWIANGGAGAALQDMDINLLQRDMESVFEDQGINARIWNRLKHPIEGYQWMTERMGAAANLGYYKLARSKGYSPLKAGTMSRQAYLDQAEKAGLQVVNGLARKVPFLGPKLRGTNQFIKAFRDRPVATATYIGATVVATSAALWWANYLYDQNLPEGHEDEKYSAIPQYIRDTHWVTPPIAGARIQFPLPFVVGPIFGGLTNRFLDSTVRSDPHAADSLAHNVLRDYDPREMIPSALRVPLEMSSNYSYFSGKPIVPTSVQAADGYMQYTNATTEPSKAVASLLGPPHANIADVSPVQLEYLLNGLTGPIGMGVLKAVNGTMTNYQPPWELADIPIVGAFFVRHPGLRSQQIEDFYTDLKSMEAAHADWALALKHMDQGEIATAGRGPFYGLRIVGKMSQTLHVLAADVVSINKSTTIPAAEKSQDIDQIVNAMVRLSIAGSGIVAQLQGKEPSEEFRKMDRQKAWATALAVGSTTPDQQ